MRQMKTPFVPMQKYFIKLNFSQGGKLNVNYQMLA